MKTVCFFGIYDPSYARNRVLISGFKSNGYQIIECRVDPRLFLGIKKYVQLFREYKKIRLKKIDHVVVGFPGHTVVWLAYFLFGRRVIFDAFLSLYDSNVFDRKVYSSWSLGACKDWFLDWYSCTLASKVLLDTHQHVYYFNQKFGIPEKKCLVVPISADDSIFYPRAKKQSSDRFTVHFHGMFIPLQGIPYIIDAAKILRNEKIIFNIIGKGQEFDVIQKQVNNAQLEKTVLLLGKKEFETLPEYMSNADVCLGIFGDTEKTKRVIPNKLYESVAMGRPVISADTPALREIFTDNETILFCTVADGASLANKILWLRDNQKKAEDFAKKGYILFKDKLSPHAVVRDLLTTLLKVE